MNFYRGPGHYRMADKIVHWDGQTVTVVTAHKSINAAKLANRETCYPVAKKN
jgi:hypothetical protein